MLEHHLWLRNILKFRNVCSFLNFYNFPGFSPGRLCWRVHPRPFLDFPKKDESNNLKCICHWKCTVLSTRITRTVFNSLWCFFFCGEFNPQQCFSFNAGLLYPHGLLCINTVIRVKSAQCGCSCGDWVVVLLFWENAHFQLTLLLGRDIFREGGNVWLGDSWRKSNKEKKNACSLERVKRLKWK